MILQIISESDYGMLVIAASVFVVLLIVAAAFINQLIKGMKSDEKLEEMRRQTILLEEIKEYFKQQP